MTPIYFKQRGAQVVLHADSIRVIVCRSIKSCIGHMYIPVWDNHTVCFWLGTTDKIIHTKRRYYFIHEECENLRSISNIDDYITQVVESTNYYINRLQLTN